MKVGRTNLDSSPLGLQMLSSALIWYTAWSSWGMSVAMNLNPRLQSWRNSTVKWLHILLYSYSDLSLQLCGRTATVSKFYWKRWRVKVDWFIRWFSAIWHGRHHGLIILYFRRNNKLCRRLDLDLDTKGIFLHIVLHRGLVAAVLASASRVALDTLIETDLPKTERREAHRKVRFRHESLGGSMVYSI